MDIKHSQEWHARSLQFLSLASSLSLPTPQLLFFVSLKSISFPLPTFLTFPLWALPHLPSMPFFFSSFLFLFSLSPFSSCSLSNSLSKILPFCPLWIISLMWTVLLVQRLSILQVNIPEIISITWWEHPFSKPVYARGGMCCPAPVSGIVCNKGHSSSHKLISTLILSSWCAPPHLFHVEKFSSLTSHQMPIFPLFLLDLETLHLAFMCSYCKKNTCSSQEMSKVWKSIKQEGRKSCLYPNSQRLSFCCISLLCSHVC